MKVNSLFKTVILSFAFFSTAAHADIAGVLPTPGYPAPYSPRDLKEILRQLSIKKCLYEYEQCKRPIDSLRSQLASCQEFYGFDPVVQAACEERIRSQMDLIRFDCFQIFSACLDPLGVSAS